MALIANVKSISRTLTGAGNNFSESYFTVLVQGIFNSIISHGHLGRHFGFFSNLILRRTAANFTEISRKHVFPASRNIL